MAMNMPNLMDIRWKMASTMLKAKCTIMYIANDVLHVSELYKLSHFINCICELYKLTYLIYIISEYVWRHQQEMHK